MSDRVGYIAGNTVGRSHINWPTIIALERESVALVDPLNFDTTWPVDITLAQAMALAWRVKKWRLSGTWEMNLSYEETLFATNLSASGEFDADFSEIPLLTDSSTEATREADIVGKVFFQSPYAALVSQGFGRLEGQEIVSNWENEGSYGFGSPPDPGDTSFSRSGSTPQGTDGKLSFSFTAGFWVFDPNTGLFSPPFGVIGRVIDDPGIPAFFGAIEFHRNPVTELSGTGPTVIKAPGTMTVKPGIAGDFVIPLQLGWRLAGEAVSSSSSGTGSAEFELEAIEFWPFANSENLPVYDSSTGAELRSPFS